jgi:peptidyl-prolyl cis-trans isomerase B (cyclophilin B)
VGTEKRERQKANRQLKLEQIAKEQAKQQTKRRGLQIGMLIAGVVGLVAIFYFLVGKDDSKDEAQSSTTVTAPAGTTDPLATGASTPDASDPAAASTFAFGTAECAPGDGSAERTIDFTAAPALCIDAAKTYTASVETNKGTMTVALEDDAYPGAVNNFVNLARFHYYDDTKCHRIIEDFVVQCGRPGDESAETKPGYTINEETPQRPYKIGDVVMAKTSAPNSTGGQFFIITGDNGVSLPQQYAIVGSIVEGLDVSEKMAAAAAPDGQPPTEDIIITKVTITEA